MIDPYSDQLGLDTDQTDDQSDNLRSGVAVIKSNEGSGAYKITAVLWDGSAWQEVNQGASKYYDVDARDFLNRAFAREGNTPMRFWEQRKEDGSIELLIDGMPLPDIPDTSKDYALIFDHSQAAGSKLAWVEIQTFACP